MGIRPTARVELRGRPGEINRLQRKSNRNTFQHAKALSIWMWHATAKLSLLTCDGLGLPDLKSLHAVAQPDAIGLQTANGRVRSCR